MIIVRQHIEALSRAIVLLRDNNPILAADLEDLKNTLVQAQLKGELS